MNKRLGLLSNLSDTIMKTFLLLAFSLTTALAQVASAEEVDKTVVKAPNKRSNAPANRQTAVIKAPVHQNAARLPKNPAGRTISVMSVA